MRVLSTIAAVITAFFILQFGLGKYTDYKSVKDAMERITFLEENRASSSEICSAIDIAQSKASYAQNQVAYDELKNKAEDYYC